MSLIHKIALTLISGVGHVTSRNLLEFFGSPQAVFSASFDQLQKVDGIGSVTARQITDTDALLQAAEQLKFLNKHDIRVLFYSDEDYPRRLKNCYDAPILLYYKGTADLNHPRIVSIVGTRKASPYGLALCRQLTGYLQSFDVLIISGLAYGIDVAAHRGSIEAGIPTVGVLGHGLDRLYPSAHGKVAREMLKNGGLLTEFPLYTLPDKENFPKRNRIIAGIADVTIVVEAASKGGALITAEIANSYNRDVFAFPGRTTDEYSQGCNFLIKTNRAALISHAKDLPYYMGWEPKVNTNTMVQASLPIGLGSIDSKIVQLLAGGILSIDELGNRAELPQSKLALHLLNLEMKGYIISLPGKIYQLI
jgi:DNA processing protein